ncbi:MAG: response regulator, partial [Gammaproteobacteria bacterium]|nr:response regulator [Gammaproteobacteria bacterium]
MDGLEATRELRKRGMEIPIIALTANAMAEDRMQYQQAGANDFLAKPIDQRQLINKLGYFLSPQETLGQRAGDGMLEADEEAELIAEFKAKFVGKLPEYLARMNELFSKQDLSGLTFIAHDLKGLGASFGFPTISEISAKIESQARQADLEKVSLDIQALNSYCATIG